MSSYRPLLYQLCFNFKKEQDSGSFSRKTPPKPENASALRLGGMVAAAEAIATDTDTPGDIEQLNESQVSESMVVETFKYE